ncbi:HAMP domain-containing protein [Candidatus Mcinerneyibacteriota bacterium]|nr:HAMP domain-containing protein [Candidatus Mcinerneyibacteriota bacterium]
MKEHPRISLKTKFLIGFLLAFLPTFVFFNILIFKEVAENLEKERLETMATVAENAAVIAEEYMALNQSDLLSLQQIVVNIQKNPDVRMAAIVDHQGELIAHSDIERLKNGVFESTEPGRGEILLQRERSETRYHNGIYTLRTDIRRWGGESRGTITVEYSREAIGKLLQRVLFKTIGLTTADLVIVVLFVYLIFTVIVKPLNQLHQGVEALARGNYQTTVNVKSNDEIGDLTREFNNMVASLREKEIIRDMFSKYLSPDIADYILKNRDKVSFGGEVVKLSIMFADIRGFTSFSEKLPPKDIVRFLNSYLTRMVDIVFQYHGTLDKFLGDGLLAIYGAPVPDENHAYHAVQAGLAMIEHMKEYNKQRLSWGEEPIYLGIGINSGDTLVGNIGSGQRTEYTVIGDTVNTASRLEGLAGENELLISAATYEQVKDLAECVPLGDFIVKNRVEPVTVYKVTGVKRG